MYIWTEENIFITRYLFQRCQCCQIIVGSNFRRNFCKHHSSIGNRYYTAVWQRFLNWKAGPRWIFLNIFLLQGNKFCLENFAYFKTFSPRKHGCGSDTQTDQWSNLYWLQVLGKNDIWSWNYVNKSNNIDDFLFSKAPLAGALNIIIIVVMKKPQRCDVLISWSGPSGERENIYDPDTFYPPWPGVWRCMYQRIQQKL